MAERVPALVDQHVHLARVADLAVERVLVVARLALRLGLFGLDKLYDVDGTLARLEAAVDQVI